MALINRPTQQAGGFQISQAIPGLPALTQSATNIIQSALSGLPSPDEARLSNAYFGAASGMDPTSDFLRNRGFDLYGRMTNARQQQGIGNLLNLVSGFSGAVAPTPGQELQDRQQTAQLNQQGQQFNQNFGFEQQQWNKQLQLLDRFLSPQSAQSPNMGAQSFMDNSQYSGQYVPYGSPSTFLPQVQQGRMTAPTQQRVNNPNQRSFI